METITVEFKCDADMQRFVNCYSGTFVSHHPNYDGSIETGRILGSWTPLVYLQRAHVKDFRVLGQDIRMFNGKIRFD